MNSQERFWITKRLNMKKPRLVFEAIETYKVMATRGEGKADINTIMSSKRSSNMFVTFPRFLGHELNDLSMKGQELQFSSIGFFKSTPDSFFYLFACMCVKKRKGL